MSASRLQYPNYIFSAAARGDDIFDDHHRFARRYFETPAQRHLIRCTVAFSEEGSGPLRRVRLHGR